MAHPRRALPYGFEGSGCVIAVLNVGDVHENEDKRTAGIGQDEPLRPLARLWGLPPEGPSPALLSASLPQGPPLSVVLTGRLSVDGRGWRWRWGEGWPRPGLLRSSEIGCGAQEAALCGAVFRDAER